MDTRNGDIYANHELAKAAGVPDEDLVTGSQAALEKLRKRLVFSGGSFKNVDAGLEGQLRRELAASRGR